MSGHNKWSSIKHQKGAADAKRGRIFTKIIKEIIVAARSGGGDLMGNARLRTAVQLAKDANMPKANIENAIKKGTGELQGVTIEEGVYEAYGPGGCAIIVEVATDNRNRTTAELRHMFTRHNGNLGEQGSVAWMFHRKGYVAIENPTVDEETVFNAVLEANAEDVKADGDIIEIYCDIHDLEKVKAALTTAKISFTTAKVTLVAQNTVELDENKGKQALDLMDELENHDDVQNTYANFDIPENILEKLANSE
jgi:YebC/PmpR family DNA-binding regulatory protein